MCTGECVHRHVLGRTGNTLPSLRSLEDSRLLHLWMYSTRASLSCILYLAAQGWSRRQDCWQWTTSQDHTHFWTKVCHKFSCSTVWCGVVWCAECAVTRWQWPGCLPTGTGKREGCVLKCALCASVLLYSRDQCTIALDQCCSADACERSHSHLLGPLHRVWCAALSVLCVLCCTAWCCALHCTVCAVLHCTCGQWAMH